MKTIKLIIAICLATLTSSLAQDKASKDSTAATTSATATTTGRYQIQVLPLEKNNYVVFRIDTSTGRVWQYNTTELVAASDKEISEFLKGLNESDAIVAQKSLEARKAQGMDIYLSPHWILLSEKPEGISVK